MALFRRRPVLTAEQVATVVQAELQKAGGMAGALPAGSRTVNETEARGRAQTVSTGTNADPLPRTQPEVGFGPGNPLLPAAIDPLGPQGRPEPRRYDYPVSWNVFSGIQREVPFTVLRQMADRCDLVRRCIEINKAQMVSLEWDVTLSEAYIGQVMYQSGEKNKAKAAALGREQYGPVIDRVKAFWEKPDRRNGLSWSEWLMMLMEEERVIDALSIYPEFTIDGLLKRKRGQPIETADVNFLIRDGSTFKPLLSPSGDTPQPPDPAYQQILHGFPRGEFQASDEPDAEYMHDQLFYHPRVNRAFTPYGYSPVEQCLVTASIWMARQEWIRAEFDDGVVPSVFVETNAQMAPEQMRAYEDIFNAELSGNTRQRKRARLLADGMKVVMGDEIDAKYRPEYDEFLVKQVGSKFGIMPTQLGIIPRTGMAGRGQQAGEADQAETITQVPYEEWVTDLLNKLSYDYLGMPRELAITLGGGEIAEDQFVNAQREQVQLYAAQLTLNEIRAQNGDPLYDFPEADMPFVIAPGGGVTFLEGEFDRSTAPPVPVAPGFGGNGNQEPANGKPPQNKPQAPQKPDQASEAQKFVAFATKRAKAGTWRDFVFTELSPSQATALNELGEAGDLDGIKAAVADLPKARARRLPGKAEGDALVAHYAPKVREALGGGLDLRAIADEWVRVRGGR